MFYDENIYFALVDVEDVAEGVFRAATTKHLHGANFLLSSESYRVSDISLMLNNEPPEGDPKIVYRNDLAREELGMDFNPAIVPLNSFSA